MNIAPDGSNFTLPILIWAPLSYRMYVCDKGHRNCLGEPLRCALRWIPCFPVVASIFVLSQMLTVLPFLFDKEVVSCSVSIFDKSLFPD